MKLTARSLALAGVSLLAFGGSPALADCGPGIVDGVSIITGPGLASNLTCTAGGMFSSTGFILTDDLVDTITIQAGFSVTGPIGIGAGAGNDFVIIEGGSVTNIGGGLNDDTITVSGGMVTGNVNGNENDDLITMTGGSVAGFLDGGAGDDTINMNGGTVLNIRGNIGFDTINLNAGTINGTVALNDGGGVVNVGNTFATTSVSAGVGFETITVNNGASILNIGIQAGGGLITINGAVGGNINAGLNAAMEPEQLDINASGSVAGFVNMGDGDTLVNVAGALTGTLTTGNGVDDINISGSGTVGGAIATGAGADTVDVTGSAQTAGISTEAGEDTITINTTSTVGILDAGADNDIVDVQAAFSVVAVDGGDGDDTIGLANTTVTNGVIGGIGADGVTMTDTIVNGVTDLGADNDYLTTTGGSLNGVLGGDGADVADLTGTLLNAAVDMGIGTDSLIIRMGTDASAVLLDGGAESDVLNFSNFVGSIGSAVNWEQIDLANTSTVTFTAASYSTDDLSLFVASTLSMANGAAGGTFNIANNLGLNGIGNVIVLETELGGSGSNTDMITVGGDVVTANTTLIQIVNVGGLGAGTGTNPGDGIAIITVTGATDADDFALAGPVTAGAFEYNLVLHAGTWYLQSALLDEVLVYATSLIAAQTHVNTMTGSMSDRMGELRHLDPSSTESASADQSAALGVSDQLAEAGGVLGGSGQVSGWVKTLGASGDYTPTNSTGANVDFEQKTAGFAAGADLRIDGLAADGDRLYVGGMFGYGDSNGSQANGVVFGVDGWTVGAYATYLGANSTATPYDGLYVDVFAHVGWLDMGVTDTAMGRTAKYDGTEWGVSLEGGYGFEVADGLIIEPQAQLSYMSIDHDSFTDNLGVAVALEEGESLQGRLGVRVQQHWELYGLGHVAPYAEASVIREFRADNQVTLDSVVTNASAEGTSYQFSLGLDARVGRDVALFGKVDLTMGEQVDQAVQAIAGGRISF